jgi:hypothetical protein
MPHPLCLKTLILDQLGGAPGRDRRYLVNRAQTVPRSLLGVVVL